MYNARTRRLECGVSAVCSLHVSPVVQTLSYVLDTSRNMAAEHTHSLNLSVTYSVKCSNCSVCLILVKRQIVHQEYGLRVLVRFVYGVFFSLLCLRYLKAGTL
jgi:hypothetical protein